MNASLTLELLARGTAIGAFVGLAVVMARGGATPARLTGALFCLAAAAHTLTQLPENAPALGWAWPPIWALSVMGAGLFWAFVRELFDDRSTLTLAQFAPALVLLLLGLGGLLTPAPVARTLLLLQNAVSGILILHALFTLWTGWRGDLVEPRRRLRGPILAISGVYAIAVIAVQIWEIYFGSAHFPSPLAAVALVTLALLALGAFGRMDSELFGSLQQPGERAETNAPCLTGDDARIASNLERLMGGDRLYRDEGLTVGSRISPSPADQPAARSPKFQLLHQSVAPCGSQSRLKRSSAGGNVHIYDRP
jgi:hypothetical protein